MSVLVLKLSGPMQSWGTERKLRSHPTDMMPSKSGVIGMIAAAFGRRRDEDISDLATLRFGVRCDQEGSILRDYHASHKWIPDRQTEDTYGKQADAYVESRLYLQDACFMVGLEGDTELLEECRMALAHPTFPPYLGRRSCVPDAGLVVAITEGDLEDVLIDWPRLANGQDDSTPMRICVECNGAGDRMRHDMPISYDFHNRQYAYRFERDMVTGENNVSQ